MNINKNFTDLKNVFDFSKEMLDSEDVLFAEKVAEEWSVALKRFMHNLESQKVIKSLARSLYPQAFGTMLNILNSSMPEKYIQNTYLYLRPLLMEKQSISSYVASEPFMQIFFHPNAISIQKQYWLDSKEEIIALTDKNFTTPHVQNWDIILPQIKIGILKDKYIPLELVKWKESNVEKWYLQLQNYLKSLNFDNSVLKDTPLLWLEEIAILMFSEEEAEQ